MRKIQIMWEPFEYESPNRTQFNCRHAIDIRPRRPKIFAKLIRDTAVIFSGRTIHRDRELGIRPLQDRNTDV